MNSSTQISRRNFLKGIGSLSISIPFWGSCLPSVADNSPVRPPDLPGSLRRTPQVEAWLEVLENGRIRILSGKVELGQGIRIAIRQVAAEELYMDLERVEVVLAETEKTPNEGYTAGSGSIQNSAMAVRYAAATARQRLLEMAAEKWDTTPDRLTLRNGEIHLKAEQKTLNFFELLNGKQIQGEVTLPVKLKDKNAYEYVGKSVSRMDLEKMVTGQPLFVQDLSFPEMVYARVYRPKNYQSTLISLDEEGLRNEAKGLLKVVKNGNFLGVIGTDTWQVEKAIRLLDTYSKWSEPAILIDRESLKEHMLSTATTPKITHEKGDITSLENTKTIRGSYFKPYTMHNSIGPASAVALWDKQVLHVWSHSQGIYPLRSALMSMLNMAEEQIHIISIPGPGCFGHTVSDDAAGDAALLALAYPGKHIKVQWSREDENAWEPYGSAMLIDVEASLSQDGIIQSWQTKVWTDSHSTRPNKEASTLLPARHIEGGQPLKSRGYLGGGHRNADPYYAIPNLKVEANFFDGPIRVSSLRSLGAYGNIFAIESLMDELAIEANHPPLSFRKKHLQDPRAIAVIEKLESMTKGASISEQEGLGFAFARYKNNAAYCAIAAKVSVEPSTGKVNVLNMWAAVDVGEVINPDGLKNQTEGGLIQAASWTLTEEVRFNTKRITSLHWSTYPIMRLKDAPQIEVEIIDRPNEPAMGGGEASTPPTGAAITNAIFQACGKRIYQLPIKGQDLL